MLRRGYASAASTFGKIRKVRRDFCQREVPQGWSIFEFRRDHVQGRVQRATLEAFLLGWQPFRIGNRVVTILYLMQQTLAL
jgi:hypothetical protein